MCAIVCVCTCAVEGKLIEEWDFWHCKWKNEGGHFLCFSWSGLIIINLRYSLTQMVRKRKVWKNWLHNNRDILSIFGKTNSKSYITKSYKWNKQILPLLFGKSNILSNWGKSHRNSPWICLLVDGHNLHQCLD